LEVSKESLIHSLRGACFHRHLHVAVEGSCVGLDFDSWHRKDFRSGRGGKELSAGTQPFGLISVCPLGGDVVAALHRLADWVMLAGFTTPCNFWNGQLGFERGHVGRGPRWL